MKIYRPFSIQYVGEKNAFNLEIAGSKAMIDNSEEGTRTKNYA